MPALSVALLSLLAAAPFATIEGHVVVDGSPLDQTLDVTIVVSDDLGNPVIEHTASGVEVVGGSFLVDDLDLAGVTDEIWHNPLFLTVTAAGLSTPRLLFSRAPVGVAAHAADEAARALTSATLAGGSPGSFATRTGLAGASGLGIPMGNIVGAPAGITDGVDDGPLTSNLGSIRVDGGGVLRVQSGAVTAAAIAAGAVGSSAIAAGAVTNAALQADAVTSAKLANTSLTDVDFAADSVSALNLQGNEPSVYEVTAAGCAAHIGSLMSVASCNKSAVGCSSGAYRNCSSDTCETTAQTTCNNSYRGVMLFGP